ncbi:MAG: winged helix-turn-helix transcriptional regulator [Planctomycetes bacterium]|nr:winged helix-turn-helix transcriptional regulator [Planctomycetota bacterium]MCH8211809.1 winged helix-turn-helix transcriptional regulator [Planctomycetota bacterium]MCH8261093.1 winged helix-turn-helix transcriptional regulator [Planctomycetota bacterium]
MTGMLEQLSARPESLGDVARFLRTLSDPTRLRLLGILQDGEQNVTALRRKLALPQPTVSHHLALLRSAGLVANRRDGKQVFYSLNRQIASPLAERRGLNIVTDAVELRISHAGVNGELSRQAPLPDADREASRAPVALGE